MYCLLAYEVVGTRSFNSQSNWFEKMNGTMAKCLTDMESKYKVKITKQVFQEQVTLSKSVKLRLSAALLIQD